MKNKSKISDCLRLLLTGMLNGDEIFKRGVQEVTLGESADKEEAEQFLTLPLCFANWI